MASNVEIAGNGDVYILQTFPAEIIALQPESGEARVVFAITKGTPDGIQVDREGNAIYWTNMGARPESGEAFPNADGTIERCTIDGQHHAMLVVEGAIVTPKQIQLDANSGLLYWSDREGMAVFRSRTDGTDLTALLRTGRWPDDTQDVLRHCVGVALDLRNRHIYWTQKGPSDGGRGRIFRMALDLPVGATAETRTDVECLIDGLPEPIDLEIDHERQQLYWTDRGDPARGGNSLNRADITAGGLSDARVLATGLKEGIGLALDFARRRAFVGDLSGAVLTVPMDGGAFSLVHRCAGSVTGLAFSPVAR